MYSANMGMTGLWQKPAVHCEKCWHVKCRKAAEKIARDIRAPELQIALKEWKK